MGFRKGTGFTNINRILQANRGSQLGQAVSGGIGGQVKQVQSGVQGAQAGFEQKSQENRLDTPEAAQKRDQVVGRFDANNYKPDESKFAVSSGLSQQYGQKKTALQEQQTAAKAQSDQQRSTIQARLDADNASIARYNKGMADLAAKNKAVNSGNTASMDNIDFSGIQDALKLGNIKALTASKNSLQGLLNTFGASAAGQEAERQAQLAGLETQYGEQTAAEKAAYMKSETERLMAENMPSEQEIKDFTKYRTGTYSGPTELDNLGSLTSKAQQAESLGGLSRSSGGRQELLRQFVGGRDYTSGQRQLDETILGQDKSANLGAAARQTRGMVGDVGQANQAAAGKAQEYVGRAKIFGEETRGQLDAAGKPISADVDAQFAAAQAKEADRAVQLKNYQDILAGTDPKYAGMDNLSRAGMAIQDASNQGYLNRQDIEQLMGTGTDTGLIERGLASGADINKLLSERFKATGAENLTRSGTASDTNVARLTALQKLMGKTGTDLEFQDDRAKYKAGGIGLDTTSFQKQVDEAERLKAIKDPTYKYKPYEYTPIQQMAIGSAPAMKAMSGTGEMLDTVASLYGGDFLSGENRMGQAGEGFVQTGAGAAAMADDAENAILKKLAKMGAGKYGGKQLNQLIDYQSQLKDQALGSITKEGTNMLGGGMKDLTTTGRLDQALAKMSGFDAAKNITGNINREISKGVNTAFNGGKTGNWATNEFNTVDAGTGKKVKIGTYANKSSSDIMKQLLSQQQLARTASYGNSGAEGAKALTELTKYYNDALKREGKKYSDEDLKTDISYDDKDVSSFLNRLKPASYNYKDEVKDSPLASKDRQIGVMAQDLEKSEMGKESVTDTSQGKIVDYKDLQPKMLASLAALNQRLKKLEGGGKDE